MVFAGGPPKDSLQHMLALALLPPLGVNTRQGFRFDLRLLVGGQGALVALNGRGLIDGLGLRVKRFSSLLRSCLLGRLKQNRALLPIGERLVTVGGV